jgi:hypothetical protein
MQIQDFTPAKPYVRVYRDSVVPHNYIFAAHGIWRPATDGMTRVKYTYHWYTQPNTALSYAEFVARLPAIGIADPVDTFGPGSGHVANTLFLGMEPDLFMANEVAFLRQTRIGNPDDLGMISFFQNPHVRGFNLILLDTQLLPALQYPLNRPVKMIVCRSLRMNHVVPRQHVLLPEHPRLVSPFDSITNGML